MARPERGSHKPHPSEISLDSRRDRANDRVYEIYRLLADWLLGKSELDVEK
jgi:hypothetical protein